MPSSPNFGFPTPVSADPSNVPLHTQQLANAVDAALQAHVIATNAHGRNNTGPNPSGWSSDSDGIISNTSGYSATNASPTLPTVGGVFTTPPSGIVFVTLSALFQNSVAGNNLIVSCEVRTGGTLGSGTVVLTAHVNRSVSKGQVVSSGQHDRISASRRMLLTGLTPNAQHNVRVMHIMDPDGSGTIFYREVFVEPWLR
jgi:hypothetical protein